MARILAVDDDADLLGLISNYLSAAGHDVESVEDAVKAESLLLNGDYDVLLTDLDMPEKSGMELLRSSKEADPSTPVVMLTGHATVETAVEAMKAGAFDYLKKPFPAPDLLVVVEKGLRQRELERENRRLRQELRDKYHFKNLIGSSPPMQAVFRLVERVGPTSSTALILGESGTGKELVARAIHETSNRSHRRFVKVNCSALVDTLLESELFGHERGAFTGAVTTKKGLFEVANGGTLFLDEVGDTSPALQAKLLRALQEGEIRHVGGTRDIPADVRVITATNQDLKEKIGQGLFREDLFYRLNVVGIALPPLRERREDLPLLIDHIVRKKGKDLRKLPRLSPEVEEALADYSWPGNVRELENVLERGLVLCDGETIELPDLPEEVRDAEPAVSASPTGGGTESEPANDRLLSLEELESRQIEKVLAAVGGHRQKAADILGITRRTLYQKIKRYGLEETLK
jgi:DNA-binding NtrC family response regulator